MSIVVLLLAAVATSSAAAEASEFILGWIAIGLLIFAGVKGSRWWFAVLAGWIALGFWAMSRGH